MMLEGRITGIEGALVGITNVGNKTIEEVKPLIKDAAQVAKKKSAELAPTVLEAKGKRFKPNLPRAMRRRQSDGGLTQTIDINQAKAPHGYLINSLDTNEMTSKWRIENRKKLGRQGHFIEAGAEEADDFLKNSLDNFMGGNDEY